MVFRPFMVEHYLAQSIVPCLSHCWDKIDTVLDCAAGLTDDGFGQGLGASGDLGDGLILR
jgi:hypothetical protein